MVYSQKLVLWAFFFFFSVCFFRAPDTTVKLWFYFQEKTKANVSYLAPPPFCFLNSCPPAVPQQKFKFWAQQPLLVQNKRVSIQGAAPSPADGAAPLLGEASARWLVLTLSFHNSTKPS